MPDEDTHSARSVYELEMAYERALDERKRLKQTRAANALANASYWPGSSPSRPVRTEGPTEAELDAAVEAAHRAWWPVRTEAVRRLMQRVVNEPPAVQTAELERLKRVKGIEIDQELAVYASQLEALEATPTTTPKASTPTSARSVVRVPYMSRPRLTEADLDDQIAADDARIAAERDELVRKKLERHRRGLLQQLAIRIVESRGWRPEQLSFFNTEFGDWTYWVPEGTLDYESKNAWLEALPRLSTPVLEELAVQVRHVRDYPEHFAALSEPPSIAQRPIEPGSVIARSSGALSGQALEDARDDIRRAVAAERKASGIAQPSVAAIARRVRQKPDTFRRFVREHPEAIASELGWAPPRVGSR